MTPEQEIRLLKLKLNGYRKNYAALKKENQLLKFSLLKSARLMDNANDFLFDTKTQAHSIRNEIDRCCELIHEELEKLTNHQT